MVSSFSSSSQSGSIVERESELSENQFFSVLINDFYQWIGFTTWSAIPAKSGKAVWMNYAGIWQIHLKISLASLLLFLYFHIFLKIAV
jgi:hypothetical protein